MITCYVRYEIDPLKIEQFEHYAKLWIPLVEKFGGKHHGYFLPHEDDNNVAIALFSFQSLEEFKTYRSKTAEDPECQAARKYHEDTQCYFSYDGWFMKPVFG